MSTSNNLSIIIELFENQRYVPLRGWSSSNLLISDRHTFTSEFGDKFNTLEEASQDLLSKGSLINIFFKILNYYLIL